MCLNEDRRKEMNFEGMRERYNNDPLFYEIVHMLYAFLMEGKVTVNELRDAATFAGYRFEIEQIRPVFMAKKDDTK